jgi:hypothetical protein
MEIAVEVFWGDAVAYVGHFKQQSVLLVLLRERDCKDADGHAARLGKIDSVANDVDDLAKLGKTQLDVCYPPHQNKYDAR